MAVFGSDASIIRAFSVQPETKDGFVDYQLCHYNTPALDLSRALYLCVVPDVRRFHFMDLIEVYTSELSRSLKGFGYTGKTPGLRDILQDLDRTGEFALAMCVTSLPVTTAESNNAFDLDTVIRTGGKEGLNSSIYEGLSALENIGEDIVDLVYLRNFPGLRQYL